MEINSKYKNYFSDINVMLTRCMSHTFRSIDSILTIIAMPLTNMLLIVFVFGGSINTGTTDSSYINYMLPGILIMAIISGISYTAIRLNSDITKGIFERFHSMPIAKSSVLWGHVLTSIVSCGISLFFVILIALLLGFRSTASIFSWLIIIGILLLFTLATTWLAIISGLIAKSSEEAGVFAYPLMLLPYTSPAFVSTESMPKALRIFSENQPVTSLVKTIRSLILREAANNEIFISLAWCLGILIVAYFFAMFSYKRRIS
jgi:ABC-2 type transport system permease protein